MANKPKVNVDVYKMRVVCENCTVNNEVDIPRGTSLKDFVAEELRGMECSYCGCPLAIKKE